MTRKEEIEQKAKDIASNWDVGRGNVFYHRVDMLCNIAQWIDEHPKNPWISVNQRLPKDGMAVLVRYVGGLVRICYNIDGVWYHMPGLVRQHHIEYWMPIPELPKTED